MSTIQFQSTIGGDGYLTLRLKIGDSEAKLPVRITIEPLSASTVPSNGSKMAWPEFLDKTYGSCAALGLERPSQGEFEHRDTLP